MRKIPVLITMLFAILACSWFSPTQAPKVMESTGRLIHPAEAQVDLSNPAIADFHAPANRAILLRYFSGNGRWEVRQEHGVTYAVRLEKVGSEYQTSLNGYYSQHGKSGLVSQTRVLVSFEKPHGYGNLEEQITRSPVGVKDVELTIADSFPGQPGYTSYLIVSGDGIFIEIYDQALQIERLFTQKAYEEVSAELAAVAAHLQEIDTTGILPLPDYYPEAFPTSSHIHVTDGIQPGIYLVDAAVNPTSPGILYLRVFDVVSGKELSANRIFPASTRISAWSQGRVSYFPYHAEITIYEGDWDTEYQARFELWHRDEAGSETKLIETTRLVNGWQR